MDVTDSADKQLKIEAALLEIKEFWDQAVFEFSTWGINIVINIFGMK